MIANFIIATLFFNAKQVSFGSIRAANPSKTTRNEATMLLKKVLEQLESKGSPPLGLVDQITEPDINLYYWETSLSNRKFLRWYTKGIVSMIARAEDRQEGNISNLGELKHSLREAEDIVSDIKKKFGIPLEWVRIPDDYPEIPHFITSVNHRLYHFAYALLPEGHKYFHPSRSFSITINADTLRIEGFLWADYGFYNPNSPVKISKSQAIEIAAKSDFMKEVKEQQLRAEAVGLTYTFPSHLSGKEVDFESTEMRQTYLVPFGSDIKIYVDAETGEIIKESISK